MRSIHNFVLKVQRSDDATKKFWVMLCSAVVMFFVVSLWLAYMNVSIARIPGADGTQITANAGQLTNSEDVQKPGFLAIFGAGTKIIFDALKARLAIKNDIVITNTKQEVNFVAGNIEPIRGTMLP